MNLYYTPDELNLGMQRSRALLPRAVAQLCELIFDATGRIPDPKRVEYVALFWVMQVCDRVVASEVLQESASFVSPDVVNNVTNIRSRFVSALSAGNHKIAIVEPYLKLGLASELAAVVRSRRAVSWRPIPTAPSAAESLNLEARRSRIEIASENTDHVARVNRHLALTAPCELVEFHHELAVWAAQECDENLRVLYTANAHQASIPFRYLMFEQRLRGTKIAIHQHGGGYGIDETHAGEEHDVALSDVFYTWGWTRSDLGDRVRALATALPARRPSTSDHRYLLMSLPISTNFYRFQPFLIPYHVERMVGETLQFLHNLDSSTEIRVRSSSAGKFPMSQLGDVSAAITVEKGRKLGVLVAAQSKLVIHNYLGTSWLETLAMNVPTVCFYDPAVFRAREVARPYIDALARVGVIHHSGVEAARFVNELKGDPSSWWSKPEVQEARETFVARYANFSENWLPGWLEEFERLLA
ncbi:MAG: hypothetical protein RL072_809 [Actinomycetota bacterium]|jgi:putative transferase (TIGR04331 family)